jgi:hypothetical protein
MLMHDQGKNERNDNISAFFLHHLDKIILVLGSVVSEHDSRGRARWMGEFKLLLLYLDSAIQILMARPHTLLAFSLVTKVVYR